MTFILQQPCEYLLFRSSSIKITIHNPVLFFLIIEKIKVAAIYYIDQVNLLQYTFSIKKAPAFAGTSDAYSNTKRFSSYALMWSSYWNVREISSQPFNSIFL